MAKFQYQFTSPAIMWVIAAAGAIALWFFVPQGNLFSSGFSGPIVFGLALANWLWVSVLAMRVHHKAPAGVNNIDELVTEGAYAVVRHPMYLANIVLALAVFIWLPSYKILAAAIWVIIVFVFWAYLEEWGLEEKFLEDYNAYKNKVPMFVPGFKK